MLVTESSIWYYFTKYLSVVAHIDTASLPPKKLSIFFVFLMFGITLLVGLQYSNLHDVTLILMYCSAAENVHNASQYNPPTAHITTQFWCTVARPKSPEIHQLLPKWLFNLPIQEPTRWATVH